MGLVVSRAYAGTQSSGALLALTWTVVLFAWTVFVFGLAEVRGAFAWWDVSFGLAICAAFLPLSALLPRPGSGDDSSTAAFLSDQEDAARAECRSNLTLGLTLCLAVGGALGAVLRSYFAFWGGGRLAPQPAATGPPEGFCLWPTTTPPLSTTPLPSNSTAPGATLSAESLYGPLPGVLLCANCGLLLLALLLRWSAALARADEARSAAERNGGIEMSALK
jgi:hypothetical protein